MGYLLMTKFLTTVALVLGMVLGSALFLVDAQPGHSISAPKYTTVNLPTCSSAVNAGRLAWDTTSVSFKVCDGSSFGEVGGSGLTVGTQNRLAKFGAADLVDSEILETGAGGDLSFGFSETLNEIIWFFDGSMDFQDNNDSFLNIGNPNPAGSSSIILNVEPEFLAMNSAADFSYAIQIDVATTDHADGTVVGLQIDAHTIDAQADEYAIRIEPGWTSGLWIAGDGSATINNITLGASQTADTQIYWNGVALVFDTDATAGTDVVFALANSSSTFLQIGNETLTNWFRIIPTNTVNSSINFMDLLITTIQELNNSTIAMLSFDLNDAEFDAAAGSTFNFMRVEAFTPDSDVDYNGINLEAITGAGGTEVGIKIGSGWDIGILNGARYVDTIQTVIGSDGGGRVTVTVTPTTSYVEMDCQDGDTGCLLALSETGAVEGQKLTLVLIALTAGDVTVPDEGGVLNGTATTLTGVDDTISWVYTGSIWVETSVSIN